jgi:hypothetical protein
MGYLTSYYTYGTPTFLIIIIALYILLTGAPHVLRKRRGG